MKYKVGDKVRIKSKEWYDKNKDSQGNVCLEDGYIFWRNMTEILGRTFKIRSVKDDCGCYIMYESSYSISEDMIEGLMLDEKPHITEQIIKDIAAVIKHHNLGVSVSEKDGKLIIEPLKANDDLPIDTPCMVSEEGEWCLRYYAVNKECYDSGNKSKSFHHLENWNYIIPFDKFNPNDIEKSLKYNIVK